MKRILLELVCLLAWRAASPEALGQASDAAVLAVQRDAEERFKRLNADVQNVLETQEVIQRRQEELRQRLDRLDAELRSLKEDQGRSSLNYASREELRKFVDKLKEVDEKREADKKLILSNIRELANVAAAPVETAKPAPRRAAQSPDELPFVYTVKKNDRLLDIVAAYNDHFQKQGQGKITLEQVLKANPGLKPERLFAGKKIQIPVPPKDAH